VYYSNSLRIFAHDLKFNNQNSQTMKQKILALLIAKFSGVRKDGLAVLAGVLALQVTTDDEAKGIVDKLTDAQVNDFVKDYRSDVDKEVNESNKTYETTLRKKYDFKEKTTVEPGNEDDPNKGGEKTLEERIAAAVAAANKPLLDRLNAYAEKDTFDSRTKQLNDILNGCKDEAFKAKALKDFTRMKFDNDDSFNEYLADTKTDVESANQRVADSNMSSESKPFFANKGDDGVSKGVASYVESLKPGGDTFTGKEV